MEKKTVFVVFIVSELYYLPIYEPVANALRAAGQSTLFLVRQEYSHRTTNTKDFAVDYLTKQGFEYRYLESDLSDLQSTFVVFSANGYREPKFEFKYSVLMSHGIGTKGGYFSEDHTNFDIRFVEGDFRLKKMQELFPTMKTKQFDVGFAKLDPAVNLTTDEKSELVKHYGLDPSKKTILYSPTFYPSTIERIKRSFPNDLKNYNIIIKPHAFSYELNAYRKHRRIFKKWNTYPNVFLAPLEEFNLTPFMAISDIMMTDESSAMFEFIALDKPMICYRDVKLRLTYRLFPNKLKKRMDPFLEKFKDSFANAHSYKELLSLVKEADEYPGKNADTRQELSQLLVGKTDGKVSERIVEHLLSFED